MNYLDYLKSCAAYPPLEGAGGGLVAPPIFAFSLPNPLNPILNQFPRTYIL